MPSLVLAVVLVSAASLQEAPASGGPPPHPLEEVVVEAPPVTEGRVALNCAVQRSGRLDDCQVVSEAPPGRGFAEAALRNARNARIDRGGRPAGARVNFTVRYRLDD